MNQKYLSLKVIWKDDDMFELRVEVNNGRYSGRTEVYEQTEPLFEFAKKLKGFPNEHERIFHSAGIKDGYSYFDMTFYQFDLTGKVGVLIHLEENVATEYRKEEKDKLKLELIIEPAAIDNFQRELESLAKNEEGNAMLIGVI